MDAKRNPVIVITETFVGKGKVKLSFHGKNPDPNNEGLSKALEEINDSGECESVAEKKLLETVTEHARKSGFRYTGSKPSGMSTINFDL